MAWPGPNRPAYGGESTRGQRDARPSDVSPLLALSDATGAIRNDFRQCRQCRQCRLKFSSFLPMDLVSTTAVPQNPLGARMIAVASPAGLRTQRESPVEKWCAPRQWPKRHFRISDCRP